MDTAVVLNNAVAMAQQSWLRWLNSDPRLEQALAVMFTYALLEIPVARKALLPGTEWQWQVLEADGMVQLTAEGMQWFLHINQLGSR